MLLRLAVLYPLTGARFLPGGIADFYIGVVVATVMTEILNYITVFRLIPGYQTINSGLQKPVLSQLLITSFSRLCLVFVIYNYSKTARSEAFPLLILSQSLKEFFRWFYNFQKVRMFNRIPKFNKQSRALSYLVCAPIEELTTAYILFQSLAFSSYQDSLDQYDHYIKMAIKFLVVVHVPVFYTIYKRSLNKYFFSSPIIQVQPKKKD